MESEPYTCYKGRFKTYHTRVLGENNLTGIGLPCKGTTCSDRLVSHSDVLPPTTHEAGECEPIFSVNYGQMMVKWYYHGEINEK